MRKSKNMNLFIEHPAMKVKKQNKVAERQLENTLNCIEQKSQFQSEKLEQSIRNLQRQLDQMEHERDRAVTPGKSVGNLFGRISVTPESREGSRRRAFSYDFGTCGGRNSCKLFPCEAPTSYHTIGFRFDPGNTSWIPWKELRNNLRDSTISALGNSTLMNSGISRLRAERREEILKLEMKRRRKRVEKEKPPSWETNYGKPTSLRRLKYPVRLDPLL